MTGVALGIILDKIGSKDKDFRYMATSDLLMELQKDIFRVDSAIERRLCEAIMVQLWDKVGDIQGLAIKCLGAMSKKASPANVESLVEKLSEKALDGKEDEREIAALGLKTLANEIKDPQCCRAISARMYPFLLRGLKSSDKQDVRVASLEIMALILEHFGQDLALYHDAISAELLVVLTNPSTSTMVRKRCVPCVASLCCVASSTLLGNVISALVRALGATHQGTQSINAAALGVVQAVGALVSTCGHRLGSLAPATYAALSSYVKGVHEDNEDILEACLLSLETLLRRAPRECAAHIGDATQLGVRFLTYDPNYNDDEDMDNADSGAEDSDNDYDGDYGGYSEEDDTSWKIRRASCRILCAIMQTHGEALVDFYAHISPVMISRFSKEREDTVRRDVYETFISLIQQTRIEASKQVGEGGKMADTSIGCLLASRVQDIVEGCTSSVLNNSRKVSASIPIGAFVLLREVLTILPDALLGRVRQVVPYIVDVIEEKINDKAKGGSTSNIRVEALSLCRMMLSSTESLQECAADALPKLVGPLINCCADKYYKVSSEALNLMRVIMQILGTTSVPDKDNYLPRIMDTLQKRLNSQDQDYQIKESAILTAGSAISICGDHPAVRECIPELLSVLQERLDNEVTRTAAVSAFKTILQSPRGSSVTICGQAVFISLTSFLRKVDRHLRQTSLEALDAFIRANLNVVGLGEEDVQALVNNMVFLLNERVGDIKLVHAIINVCNAMLATSFMNLDVVTALSDNFIPNLLTFMQGSYGALFHGRSFECVDDMFQSLVRTDNLKCNAYVLSEQIFQTILASTVGPSLNADAVCALGACFSSVICAGSADILHRSMATLIGYLHVGSAENINSGSQMLRHKLAALYCIGEVGKRTDLSEYRANSTDVYTIIVNEMHGGSEDIRFAASHALGGVASGNIAHFLPILLAGVNEAGVSQTYRYDLLFALKELIAGVAESGHPIMRSSFPVQNVTAVLFKNCELGEEGVQNVVGECLGQLLRLEPEHTIERLVALAGTKSPVTRGTVVTALKFSMSQEALSDMKRSKALKGALSPLTVSRILGLIEDEESHEVRKRAVQALNAVARADVSLLLDVFQLSDHKIESLLYAQCTVLPKLVQTVNLGPFKHTIDAGLDLRKAAFECIDVLVERTGCNCLDIYALVDSVVMGLSDHSDIKMLCHLILAKLCKESTAVPAIVTKLQSILDAVDNTLNAKIKADAVKQEKDRHEEMLRSALGAVAALNNVDGIGTGTWRTFMDNIAANPALATLYP